MCDLYVVFDDVQFKKRYVENRNRIEGGVWLTVPVKSRGRYHQKINMVEIDGTSPWKRKLLGTLRHVYGGRPGFKETEKELTDLVKKASFEKLLDLNLVLIRWLREKLAIDTPMVFSSELGIKDFSGSDLILEICRTLGADRYLCGPSGKNYLNFSSFERSNIQVLERSFASPSGVGMPAGEDAYLSSIHHIICLGTRKTQKLIKETCA